MGFCPWRLIKEMFAALSSIAVAFASNGPGLMDESTCVEVERQYMRYRESYNSYSYEICKFTVCAQRFQLNYSVLEQNMFKMIFV